MAVCNSGSWRISVPLDSCFFADLPDADLPRAFVCGLDLSDLYVDYDLCQPFGYFQVADHERAKGLIRHILP